ncbi:MAG: ABC transporter ATP-binding protein [Myxococcales bacterium]|nr:ABC transporter ATP-binding protein [Myxococcales bacterium]
MPEVLLKAADVSVVRGGRTVLTRVSLEVAAGSITAILGPNGAGKSTLLRAAAGLLPYSGRVELLGHDSETLEARERARQLAFVPQRSQLSARMTSAAVVAQGRYPHRGGLGRLTASDHAAVERAMERVQVQELAERLFPELSYGEQRRVLLARALATEARVLLLDEPTASLDIPHVLSLRGTLRSLADDGHAIAVVLHDLEDARRCTDHALLLDRGEAIANGTTDEVITAEHVARVYGVTLIENDALGFRLEDGR